MAASPDLKLSYSDRESAMAKFDLQKSRPEEEEFDASDLLASRGCRV